MLTLAVTQLGKRATFLYVNKISHRLCINCAKNILDVSKRKVWKRLFCQHIRPNAIVLLAEAANSAAAAANATAAVGTSANGMAKRTKGPTLYECMDVNT